MSTATTISRTLSLNELESLYCQNVTSVAAWVCVCGLKGMCFNTRPDEVRLKPECREDAES